MSNGNIFVNASGGQGGAGVMYEVNDLGNIIWGPYNSDTEKGFRYECDHPGIIALEPYMNSTATSSCFNASYTTEISDEHSLDIYPNPSKEYVNINFFSSGFSDIRIVLYNSLGENILNIKSDSFSGQFNKMLDLSKFPSGFYTVKVITSDGVSISKKLSHIK